MSRKTLGELNFSDLKVGDKIVSCEGRPGWIAGLWPEGKTVPTGHEAEYGGEILMLWRGVGGGPPTWSLTYIYGCKVVYVGRDG